MLSTVRFVARTLWEKRQGRQPLPRILELRQRRLERLVAHARARSPFYAEHYRNVPSRGWQLEHLPPINKTVMMRNFDRFLTDRCLRQADLEEFFSKPSRLGQWYQGKYAVSRTSGTQGLQAVIVQDRACVELLHAIQMGRGSVFPAGPKAIVQRLFEPARLAVVTIGRGFYPSAAALAYAPHAARWFVNRLWLERIEPLETVVAELNRFRPQVLLAYASVLEILAREQLAGRLQIANPQQLRQVINMSEPLSDGARKLIGEAFGLPVTNNYASGECMALTTGCPLGHGMHLQADWAILEVVDEYNRPVPDGQPGCKVLLTNLYNYVQPFIRYELADVVTMSAEPCPCGSPLPLVRRVEGRTDELVWIRAGGGYRQVHPYVFVDCLDEYPNVGWYQFVQTERNRFLLRAAPAPGRRVGLDDLRQVLERGIAAFGLAGLIQVDIELTPDVAPDPKSGKLKRITSRIGPPADELRAAA